MLVSPFTFYRGAAAIMSADLTGTPTAGLHAQLCGDAHLLNFGVFGSPERRLVFDLNDFDETLPGPFEYDVKIDQMIREQFRAYRATLQPHVRHLLEQFEVVDVARKVVGVGSVGTRAFIVLLQGRDDHDPLFLQIKEATASVLERHLPRSRYRQHGQRVVQGQRMMQAASDIYLGWTKGPDGRHYYWRQLRDMKGAADVAAMTPHALTLYARACGWTMARAHARSGDPVAIAAYLGANNAFSRSMADFAQRYADQNERDYQEFAAAIHSGRLAAVEGVLTPAVPGNSGRGDRHRTPIRRPRAVGLTSLDLDWSVGRLEIGRSRRRRSRSPRRIRRRAQPGARLSSGSPQCRLP